MKKLIYRVQLAFWLWELSGMSVLDVWSYAGVMICGYENERRYISPKEMVEIDMSYWERGE